jgi:hypothetical protein
LAAARLFNLAKYLPAWWIDQDHTSGFENAAGPVNRERQGATSIAIARCTKASLNHIATDRAEEQEFSGRRGAREPDCSLAMFRAFFDVGRLYRAACFMVADEGQLATTPTTSALASADWLVMKSLALTTHVKARERLAPNPFISVQRLHPDCSIRVEVGDESTVFAAFRPCVCGTNELFTKRTGIDRILQLWIIPTPHLPNSPGGINGLFR